MTDNLKSNELREHARNCPKCTHIYDTIGILTGIIMGHKIAEEGK